VTPSKLPFVFSDKGFAVDFIIKNLELHSRLRRSTPLKLQNLFSSILFSTALSWHAHFRHSQYHAGK
jgi:hypothetical protein